MPSGLRRASQATLIFSTMSMNGHDALERRVPAFLGKLLILDLDRDDARLLIAAHGVMHVEQAAVARVGVGDHARVDVRVSVETRSSICV